MFSARNMNYLLFCAFEHLKTFIVLASGIYRSRHRT